MDTSAHYPEIHFAASAGAGTKSFHPLTRESKTETGLYYYRARYYDQSTGRFLSEDPIQFYGGTNFYAYTHNRPTYYVDAFGLQERWNDYKNVGNIFDLIRANGFANEALGGAQEWARATPVARWFFTQRRSRCVPALLLVLHDVAIPRRTCRRNSCGRTRKAKQP